MKTTKNSLNLTSQPFGEEDLSPSLRGRVWKGAKNPST